MAGLEYRKSKSRAERAAKDSAGYLDAELRMLQPTRAPAADNSNITNGGINANLTLSNKDTQSPENEIDRAFGRIEI